MSADVTVRYPANPESVRDGVARLLRVSEDDFYPPLTDRVPPDSTDDVLEMAVNRYLDTCLEQEVLVAVPDAESDRLVGFLTFAPGYDPGIGEAYSDCIYVSTAVVDPEWRRCGVATAMNERFLGEIVPASQYDVVVRRTWETNTASRRYIESLGFTEVSRRENARPGDVDTIYYAKRF